VDDRRATPYSVLIVEDEADLASLICYNLGREGYRCECVAAGDAALERIRRQPPDLVLLDRMLPGLSGDEVARMLKADPSTAAIPVMVLTAKAAEADQLAGFALGAEDYIIKPFSMKVLLARVAAVLRRGKDRPDEKQDTTDTDVLTAGVVRLFPSRHEVTVAGSGVSLTAAEFRLLKALMAARGRVLTRPQLLDAVSGSLAAVTDRTIDVHITALRRKLGVAANWIQTVRGVGYTVRPPAPPVPP
jgi:two-component system phosphate regulon response regulator PhoB